MYEPARDEHDVTEERERIVDPNAIEIESEWLAAPPHTILARIAGILLAGSKSTAKPLAYLAIIGLLWTADVTAQDTTLVSIALMGVVAIAISKGPDDTS